MTTWVSNPELVWAAIFGLVMLLSVSLCEASTFRNEAEPRSGLSRLPVLEDSVVITPPKGYCIDRLASLSKRQSAFVLMASCDAVTGDSRGEQPRIAGLLSASVDGRGGAIPSLGELNRFFFSDRGRAAISRSGRPEAMELGAVFSRDGVLYLHGQESGSDPAFGGQSWRAVFALNGRMVTATLRDLAGQPIACAEGFRTVEQFVDNILAASPTRQDSALGATPAR